LSGSVKTCGTCVHRNAPVVLTPKFVLACSRVAYNSETVQVPVLLMLFEELQKMSHRKYKCRKESDAWTHLFDRACGFWQPEETAA
jgi:hypothetical protein